MGAIRGVNNPPGGVMLSMRVLSLPLVAAQMMCTGCKQILHRAPYAQMLTVCTRARNVK